ncbi:hypothetical protein BOO86_06655 [Mycobacterium sp. CBMA 234]|uniref:TetR/AcrR family transcriptional regulator n=1 Tax=Mycolicibacterium sp. CBMA 234 TaxID=1918495 RepID=UPI0012DDC9D0|nr:TetR/AcrR family transcriptional regulator [Mycolicibacterium sp. CBMA 234]MUL64139.1 hypothetical protein [Mycolicibacterium sp. CBMA 234]
MAQPESVATRSDRDRILDAAEVCLRDSGIRQTTMAEVAQVAGVSRAWLYRLYQSKTSLFGAVMVRMDDAFLRAEGARVRAAATLVDAVVETVLLARKAQQRPLIVKLRESEPDAFTSVSDFGMLQHLPRLSSNWVGFVAEGQRRGEVRSDIPLDWAAEWIARLIMSLSMMPTANVDPDDRESLRAFVGAFLIPGLGPA